MIEYRMAEQEAPRRPVQAGGRVRVGMQIRAEDKALLVQLANQLHRSQVQLVLDAVRELAQMRTMDIGAPVLSEMTDLQLRLTEAERSEIDDLAGRLRTSRGDCIGLAIQHYVARRAGDATNDQPRA